VTQKLVLFYRSCYTAVVTQELTSQELTSRWSTCVWTPTKLLLLKFFQIFLFWRQAQSGGGLGNVFFSEEIVPVGRRNVWRTLSHDKWRLNGKHWCINCDFGISDATLSQEMTVKRQNLG
jgi:hypothetical protein